MQETHSPRHTNTLPCRTDVGSCFTVTALHKPFDRPSMAAPQNILLTSEKSQPPPFDHWGPYGMCGASDYGNASTVHDSDSCVLPLRIPPPSKSNRHQLHTPTNIPSPGAGIMGPMPRSSTTTQPRAPNPRLLIGLRAMAGHVHHQHRHVLLRHHSLPRAAAKIDPGKHSTSST
jgi:hypothetical protein